MKTIALSIIVILIIGMIGIGTYMLIGGEKEETPFECDFPALAEKQTPINQEERYFCCSEGIDMQRDALKIKTCYLEDGILENRHLIWFIFDESSGEYILEKESREENGIYCTYLFSPEGQVTGRVC